MEYKKDSMNNKDSSREKSRQVRGQRRASGELWRAGPGPITNGRAPTFPFTSAHQPCTTLTITVTISACSTTEYLLTTILPSSAALPYRVKQALPIGNHVVDSTLTYSTLTT